MFYLLSLGGVHKCTIGFVSLSGASIFTLFSKYMTWCAMPKFLGCSRVVYEMTANHQEVTELRVWMMRVWECSALPGPPYEGLPVWYIEGDRYILQVSICVGDNPCTVLKYLSFPWPWLTWLEEGRDSQGSVVAQGSTERHQVRLSRCVRFSGDLTTCHHTCRGKEQMCGGDGCLSSI